MLKLYVMRHAKSSWAIPGARDFDRELNERGLFDLEKISQAIKSRNYIPQMIYCSPSTRTRQTLEGLRSALAESIPTQFPETLYSCGLNEYIDLIQETKTVTSLMIIGHNPMCGALATALPRPDSDFSLEPIAYSYPTSALSVIEFDCDSWDQIKKSSGNLTDCVIASKL